MAFHVGLDARAARQLPSYLGVKVYWCPANANFVNHALLDFVPYVLHRFAAFKEPDLSLLSAQVKHTGVKLADELVDVMKYWRIEEKVRRSFLDFVAELQLYSVACNCR